MHTWRLTLTAFVVLASGVVATPWADANAVMIHRRAAAGLTTGDGHGNNNQIKVRSGNGKHNKAFTTVFSPTVNRGRQQISNTNVSGKTITKVSSCRKRHHC